WLAAARVSETAGGGLGAAVTIPRPFLLVPRRHACSARRDQLVPGDPPVLVRELGPPSAQLLKECGCVGDKPLLFGEDPLELGCLRRQSCLLSLHRRRLLFHPLHGGAQRSRLLLINLRQQ